MTSIRSIFTPKRASQHDESLIHDNSAHDAAKDLTEERMERLINQIDNYIEEQRQDKAD